MKWEETGDWLVSSPLFGILVTLAAYAVGRWAQRRTGSPLVQPVFVAILLIGGLLLALDIDYADYLEGAAYVGFWLGPATVALALPLHAELSLVRRSALPLAIGLLVGSAVSIVSAVLLTRWAGGTEALQLTMAPKAATTPVSIAIAEQVGGIPALTAVITIVTGIIGAMVGPWLLDRVGVRDKRARGIALGTTSHGIGTARALQESVTEGAFSALTMALAALATSALVPLLLLVL